MENRAYNKSPNISNMSDSFEKTPPVDFRQPYGGAVVHQHKPPQVYVPQPIPMRSEPPPHVRKPDSPAQERWKFIHFIVFSAIVFFCCNPMFGVGALVLAVFGYMDVRHGRQASAQTKYKLAMIVSVAGVLVGLITIFIIVALYMYACYGDMYGEPKKVVSCFAPVN